MAVELDDRHLDTYQAIFRQPAAHNLAWRDVKSMLAEFAEVGEEKNGGLKVTRNGQTLLLHPGREKEVAEIEQLLELRHFLERSSVAPTPVKTGPSHYVVVIDHREARVYTTELVGAVPKKIHPIEPKSAGRYLHNVDNNAHGQRKPESRRYYESVIKALHDADQILIFGAGTGASSAMNQLVAELKQHHKELSGRVVGAVVVDETKLTSAQLLAKARDIYERASAK